MNKILCMCGMKKLSEILLSHKKKVSPTWDFLAIILTTGNKCVCNSQVLQEDKINLQERNWKLLEALALTTAQLRTSEYYL